MKILFVFSVLALSAISSDAFLSSLLGGGSSSSSGGASSFSGSGGSGFGSGSGGLGNLLEYVDRINTLL